MDVDRIIKEALSGLEEEYKDEVIEKLRKLLWVFSQGVYGAQECMGIVKDVMSSYGFEPLEPEIGDLIHWGNPEKDKKDKKKK